MMNPSHLVRLCTLGTLGTVALLVTACSSPEPRTPTPPSAPAPQASVPKKADDSSSAKQGDPKAPAMDFYSLKAADLGGDTVDLSAYRGKVTLVVNVASECGFTPQYAGLEKLYTDLKGRGFAVLGFPSNDFGAQEPGTPAEIRTFCTEKYQVDFPLFAKVQTKAGANQSEVYTQLGKATGKLPNWNFCKYLVGKDGTVRHFYASKVTPESPELREAIEAALQ